MKTPEILNLLKSKDIDIWAEKDRLKFKAPEGAMTPELKAILAENKTALLVHLKESGRLDAKVYPLSYNQQSLYFVHQFDPKAPAYNIGAACRIVSNIDKMAFEKSFARIVQRHPVLRTTYALSAKENQFCQEVHDSITLPIEYGDASNWQENDFRSRIESYYRQPFDLENGPVFRVHLFERKSNDFILLFAIHHIACDLWSLNILLTDFFRFYEAELNGQIIGDNTPILYTDFVVEQLEFFNGKGEETFREFWREHLKGVVDPLRLPSDNHRPEFQRMVGSSLFFSIPDNIYGRLKSLSSKQKTTLSCLMLSLFNILLFKYSGQNRFSVGMPAAARKNRRFHHTCGYFVNPVMVPNRISEMVAFDEYLADVTRIYFKCLEYQDYPFSLLVEKLIPDRQSNVSPGFQVMFNILNMKTMGSAAYFLCGDSNKEGFSVGSLTLFPIPIAQQEGQYELTLEFLDTDNELKGVLKYNTDLFSLEFAENFCNHYVQLAEAVTNKESLTIKEILSPIDIAPPVAEKRPVVLAGTFTIELIEETLKFWLKKFNLDMHIEFAPYNQIFQLLLEPASIMYGNKNGTNVLLIRFEDWLHLDRNDDIVSDPSADQVAVLKRNMSDFSQILKSAAEQSASTFIIVFCPESTRLSSNARWKHLLYVVQDELYSNLAPISGIYTIKSQDIFDFYPVDEYDEPILNDIAHIPYSESFFMSIGTMIARRLYVLNRKAFKVIAVDCDNTLWDGVVGEDGILGVKIGTDKKWFQQFLIDQYNSGRIICLCSKNDESDVRDVFERNPDMILKWNHIAGYKVNWNLKSENLRVLANELNLGIDSFIFIDDSPIECGEVRAQCPEVLVIQFPEKEDVNVERYFNHFWCFDITKTTSEDISRSEFYVKDRERKDLQKTSVNYGEFLKSLDLKIKIGQMQLSQLARVAQLTQRTNQFNTTKIIRSEKDIQNKCSKSNAFCHTVQLKDRFGDYGLVGVMISEHKGKRLEIDSLLLSCRALGRGVEHKMLAYAGQFAQAQGLDFVELIYRPTERNQPAFTFLDSVGKDFALKSDSEIKYQIPSDVAATTTFQPLSLSQEPTSILEVSSKKKGGVKNRAVVNNDSHNVILDIAQNLTRIADIEKKISGQLSHKSTEFGKHLDVTDLRSILKSLYGRILKHSDIDPDDNFFEIGGKSILIPLIVLQLRKEYNINISIVDVLRYPTISSLASFITGENVTNNKLRVSEVKKSLGIIGKGIEGNQDIAIIGMAGRFPGAENIDEFWQNIIDGKETIDTFSEQECRDSGVPEEILSNPEFIPRGGVVKGPDLFDASFFGYSPIEAQYIDPQQRIFLECAWHAIEHAGYNPGLPDMRIGVYAGCGMNYYLMKNLLSNGRFMEDVINPMTFFGNDKDFLTTRVSYKLDIKGPSINIQSACSTSLVAVHLACQALITNQCDIAICGGVSLQTPRMKGYIYQEGHILSKDGYCRAFDEAATGTVFGEGAGVLVLKKLDVALKERDTIHAIIKGIAVNNDGSNKVGFTAPSVDGQASVIEEALNRAGVSSSDISYIESHGTGTQLGDPIEITALSKVFSTSVPKEPVCAIGSVKPNIGHLDVAAGVTGVIKTALALKHRLIPPLIHLKKENPNLGIEKTPFYFPTEAKEWISNGKQRFAGVSSFGIGGTNAHAVLSEASTVPASSKSSHPSHLFLLSAKTATALEKSVQNLKNHLLLNKEINLSDVAYTLMIGRKHHAYRRFIIYSDADIAQNDFRLFNDQVSQIQPLTQLDRKIVFMFSGQGSQYINMGKELYEKLHVYRTAFDHCADILLPIMKLDIRDIIFNLNDKTDHQINQLNETYITQPALFCVEYAFAKFLIHCGVHPDIMIGHSIGEYVAACLSGVFSLEDALKIVATRGKLMQEQPAGAMLALSVPEKEISSLLDDDISIAAVNSPMQCVLSGPISSIDNLQKRIDAFTHKKIPMSRLKTSHAFHSKMMIPAATSLSEVISQCRLSSPKIPYVSNVTGKQISEKQAMDPKYWADHVTGTVRFSEGVNTLITEPKSIIIEIGPGLVLTNLVRQHLRQNDDILLLPSLPHRDQKISDFPFMLKSIGSMWAEGIKIDWKAFYEDDRRMRIPLPVYPFERKSFWIDCSSNVHGIRPESTINNSDKSDFDTIAPEIQLARENREVLKQPGGEGRIISNADSKLMGIWKSVLGYKDLNIEDNFFELGGSSLMAVALFDKIEGVFGIRLPLSTLYEAPTIIEMSLLLKSEDFVPSWNSLVTINEGNKTLPPFFCVHAEGGNVLEYRLFSKYIGTDQPFYGIQAKGLQGESVVEDSIEEMATSYIKELKTVQPHGPYYIGGYCLGGLVAYEIAQQLINEGDEIGLLVLVSNATPDQMRKTIPNLTKYKQFAFKVLERIELEMDNLSGMSSRNRKNHIIDRIIRLRIAVQTNFEAFIDNCFSALGFSYNYHSRTYILKKSVSHTNLAYAVYEPKPITCPIHLIKVTRPLRERELMFDKYWGWDVFAQNGITTYLVKAFHKNLLREPNVRALSSVVGKLLKDAYK